MNMANESKKSKADKPRVIRGPSGHYHPFFPAKVFDREQKFEFKNWNEFDESLALQVTSAFVSQFAKHSYLSRDVKRGNLNKLYKFVSAQGIKSLTDITDNDVQAFKKFLEPVRSTRVNDWSTARSVIERAFSTAGKTAPKMETAPWARKPEEWSPPVNKGKVFAAAPIGQIREADREQSAVRSHPRSRLANLPVAKVETGSEGAVSRLDVEPTVIEAGGGRMIFFPARGAAPAHRQDFTDWWLFDRSFAKEVMSATIALKRNNTRKALNTWRTRCRYLMSFLKQLPVKERPRSFSDFSSTHFLAFRTFIDKGDVANRTKNWRAATAVIAHACKAHSKAVPAFPVNPWPGHAARQPAATRPLTASEVGAVLNACMRSMRVTLSSAEQTGYEGVTLAELFPFVVTLAFWTLFNPETVAGIRRSQVRSDFLGRFAVVGFKGRSTTDQVATFPISDDHPCAPKAVIQNVEKITKPLRNRLPPDKRDYLFVGLMRQPYRAKAMVQRFADVEGGMMSFYRDRFCKDFNLKKFTLQQVRVTGAVIVNRLFGGDVKTSQLLLNHLHIATTDSYVRRDARRVEAERLADQIEKRSRFVRSGGARDVRDQPEGTQSAATPGFACADPFFPPAWLGQDEGMCAAYGGCPTCPLGSVDRRCPHSFASVLRLRNQIREAHRDPRMPPRSWTDIWKPRLEAIEEKWLPMFSDDVRAEAAADIRDVVIAPLPFLDEV
jgi:hypothetical protein